MKDKNSEENQVHYFPIGMCFGTAIGTALGMVTKNLPSYTTIGMSIGMCIGALIDAQNRKKAKGDSQSDMEETE